MFEYAKGNICFWPVDLPQRMDDGNVVPVPVLIQFALFTRDELKARRATITENARALAAYSHTSAEAWEEMARMQRQSEDCQEADLRERLMGWKGIVKAGTEEELPYSDELRDWLIADELRFEALNRALYEASRGAVRKN